MNKREPSLRAAARAILKDVTKDDALPGETTLPGNDALAKSPSSPSDDASPPARAEDNVPPPAPAAAAGAEPAARAVDTPLTLQVQALYEDTVVPVARSRGAPASPSARSTNMCSEADGGGGTVAWRATRRSRPRILGGGLHRQRRLRRRKAREVLSLPAPRAGVSSPARRQEFRMRAASARSHPAAAAVAARACSEAGVLGEAAMAAAIAASASARGARARGAGGARGAGAGGEGGAGGRAQLRDPVGRADRARQAARHAQGGRDPGRRPARRGAGGRHPRADGAAGGAAVMRAGRSLMCPLPSRERACKNFPRIVIG